MDWSRLPEGSKSATSSVNMLNVRLLSKEARVVPPKGVNRGPERELVGRLHAVRLLDRKLWEGRGGLARPRRHDGRAADGREAEAKKEGERLQLDALLVRSLAVRQDAQAGCQQGARIGRNRALLLFSFFFGRLKG